MSSDKQWNIVSHNSKCNTRNDYAMGHDEDHNDDDDVGCHINELSGIKATVLQ